MNVASSQQLHSRPTRSGSTAGLPRGRSEGSGPPQSPPATRAARRSWRDPRLLIGLTIVAACVLLGARLLAGADDTVPVWSMRVDRAAGESVRQGDLERVNLRFGTPQLAGRYLSANDQVPPGMVLSRDVAAGELLPRAALGEGAQEHFAEVPIALPSDAVPAALRSGDLVDVWVTPSKGGEGPPEAARVLRDVRVVAVPRTGSAFGPSATRQVLVGVPEEDEDQLASAIAELATGSAVLVKRG